MFKHELLDQLLTYIWSHNHVNLHTSLYVQSDFNFLRFRYPIKLIRQVYLSCTCDPKWYVMYLYMHMLIDTSCMLTIQCSTHSLIRHYLVVVSWLGFIHIPISLTLIIAVIGLNQLDIGHLGKRGFDLIGFASWDWNHPAMLLLTVALLVRIACTSCAYCLHFLCLLLFVSLEEMWNFLNFCG